MAVTTRTTGTAAIIFLIITALRIRKAIARTSTGKAVLVLLPSSRLLAHESVERGHVLVGDAQQFGYGGAERLESNAVFGRQGKPRADVSLVINEERRKRPM